MTTASALPISLVLAPPLFTAASDTAGPRIEAELSDLLSDLGVPRRPVVRLEAAEAGLESNAAIPMIRVFGDGKSWPIAPTVVHEALAYVAGVPSVASVGDAQAVLDRLAEAEGEVSDLLGDLLALVCRHALSVRPGVLLRGSPLQPALALGISLSGHAPFAVLREDNIEQFISERAASTVDVLVEPVHARTLTTENEVAGRFPFLRDGIFAELGLPLPPLRLCLDTSLRPGGFALRIHGLRTMPRIGLPSGTILVNDSSERLALLNIGGEAAVNPATGLPNAVVGGEHDKTLQECGLTTWDPFAYLILTCAAELRRNAYALMTSGVAAGMVNDMGLVFPALKASVDAHLPLGALTTVLRELLLDQVSIRNLRLILERLLQYETDPEASRSGDPVAFVRWGLADQISHKASRNTGTIVVYLLATVLEEALAGWSEDAAGEGSEGAEERLRAGLASELSHLPPTAQIPAVLTQDKLRRTVRDALRHRFPQVTVLSYGDLLARYNIQPAARIS